MISKTVFIFIFVAVINIIKVSANSCYFNAECPYMYFATKTPYDTVRGDLRDYKDPLNCKAITLWSMIRHGNRYPGSSVMREIKDLWKIKEEIVKSYEKGTSKLCAQDIQDLHNWHLSKTMENNPSRVTTVGYNEVYNIGKRIQEKYPHLLNGSEEEVYIRSATKKSRALDSAQAFVDGISAKSDVKLKYRESWDVDNVASSFENCTLFHENLKKGQVFNIETDKFLQSDEAIKVKTAVQQRLGIKTQLSSDQIWVLYELCRFDRSWAANLKSPWCSVFSNEDLIILEYRDDVKRFYKNGYGVWFNPRLGAQPFKDLYEKFVNATKGILPHKVTTYISHATMVEMMFTALDMFKDPELLTGSKIPLNRLWRNSLIDPMANNFIGLLYDCYENGTQSYKFQLLHNEKLSGICPDSGCTWEQFADKFSPFLNVTLDFCNMSYEKSKAKTVN